MDWQHCLLTPSSSKHSAGLTHPPTTVKIPSFVPIEKAVTRRKRTPLGEFAQSLKKRQNVIVRIHQEERRHNQDEFYFVAQIKQKAVKTEKPAIYSTNHFNKGTWLVEIQWYQHEKTDGRGNRIYTKGSMQYIPCESIVQVTRKIELEPKRGGCSFVLSEELNDHIENYGDLSYY